jgi:hypothetical protein
MNVLFIPKPSGLILTNENIPINISTSYFAALNEIMTKIQSIDALDELQHITNIFQMYEYLFSIIEPNKIKSILFYELHEILSTFGMYKMNIQTINQIRIQDNTLEQLFQLNPLIEFPQMLGECDLLVSVCNEMDQLYQLLNTIHTSLKGGGSLIIQLTMTPNSKLVQIIYMLGILFEKTYMVKPVISNILSSDFFIVAMCYSENYLQYVTEDIHSISIPPFFMCKIEEFIYVNGHKQLDNYEQILNCFFNKNKSIKIDMVKKTNFQKAILWCDKYKIPYIRADKINMFLTEEAQAV